MQLIFKPRQAIQKALLIVLGIAVFCGAIFFHQPVDAATQAYREMSKLGLVDGIVTPQEIGLDYLAQPPVKVADLSRLMNLIHVVNESADQIKDQNMPLTIELCQNQPAYTNEPEKNQVCNSPEARNSEAVGLLNTAGQPEPITPKLVKDATNIEYENKGDLERGFGNSIRYNSNSNSSNILLADASGRFLQARKLFRFNLIVRNKTTGRLKIVRGVNPNSFCRDILNSFARGKVRRLAMNPSEII